MNIRKKIRAIYYTAFIAMVIFSIYIYIEQYFLIAGLLATNFAVEVALMTDDPNKDYDAKNRTVAMMLSKVPGLGQWYLGKSKKSMFFLSAYAIMLLPFILMFEFRADALYLLGIFFAILIS